MPPCGPPTRSASKASSQYNEARERATAAAGAAAAAIAAATEGAPLGSIEAQVSAGLVAAHAGGTEHVRKTLKELLLQWHPDKCHSGTDLNLSLQRNILIEALHT